MPAPGVPNNPEGVNSFTGFGDEPMYGEATKDAALARSAPVAGAAVVAGAIAAPRRASRNAARGGAQPVAAPLPPPGAMQPSPNATLAMQWQQIAAIPGASDLVREYAALAARNPVG